MKVVLAGSEYFDEVVVLFEQYRVFYKQSSAQTLYESLGYSRNQEFQHYALQL